MKGGGALTLGREGLLGNYPRRWAGALSLVVREGCGTNEGGEMGRGVCVGPAFLDGGAGSDIEYHTLRWLCIWYSVFALCLSGTSIYLGT